MRYNDIPEVDNATKSGYIAQQIVKLGDLSDNDKAYNYLAEQLNLLFQTPSRYRYTLKMAFQICHKSIIMLPRFGLRQLVCLPSIQLLQQSVSSNLNVRDIKNCITFLKSRA